MKKTFVRIAYGRECNNNQRYRERKNVRIESTKGRYYDK